MEALHPALEITLEIQVLSVHVNHPTSRNRRRTRILQIENFKQQFTVIFQANSISIAQRKDFVIVHYTVHIFHPNRVHVSVK